MAKKKAAKKAAKKTTAPQKLSIKLDARNKAKAEACIKKSGKVTFRIKEITVSRIPAVLSSNVIID